MAKGWVPAHRRIYEPGHWLAPTKRDPSCRRDAWIDLCQMATHQPRETKASGTLERAEMVASLRTLGERWKWSKDRVKRFMSELEVRTAIETVRETPDGTVYRIVNYDTYAAVHEDERDTERDTKRDRSETEARQEQQQNHSTRTASTSAFEELWQVRKRGPKGKALDAYRRAVPSKVDHATILGGWRRHVAAAREPEFVAHLFRWIRDERWDEDVGRNGQAPKNPLHSDRLRAS